MILDGCLLFTEDRLCGLVVVFDINSILESSSGSLAFSGLDSELDVFVNCVHMDLLV